MGRHTRLEILLSSMKKSTRNSLYRIEDNLNILNVCSQIDVYFNDDASVKKITKKKIKCNMDNCDPIQHYYDMALIILLFISVFGIILLLMANNYSRYHHINLNLHHIFKNRDAVIQLTRFFNEYHDHPYSLIVKIIP